MRHFLVYLISVFILSSCMLDQTAPKPPATVAPMLMQVVMLDLGGAEKGAQIQAMFGRSKHTATGIISDAEKGLKAFAQLGLLMNEVRGYDPSQCEFHKVPKTPPASSSTSSDDSVPPISVGRVGFGPALSTSLLPLAESDTHVYTRDLEVGFPPDKYQLAADGTSDFPSFSEVFSVPETLAEVKANGTAFDNADVIIKRSDTLRVEWKAPLMFNDQSAMYLDILAQTETDVYHVECGTMEKGFYDGTSVFHWDIPSVELAKMPATPNAQIRLTRMHHLKARTPHVAGDLLGVRKYIAPAILD